MDVKKYRTSYLTTLWPPRPVTGIDLTSLQVLHLECSWLFGTMASEVRISFKWNTEIRNSDKRYAYCIHLVKNH
jgi:hypothetical protein